MLKQVTGKTATQSPKGNFLYQRDDASKVASSGNTCFQVIFVSPSIRCSFCQGITRNQYHRNPGQCVHDATGII